MLDLQNVSVIQMFKFFGSPSALVEDLFQKKNIKTIGDLRKVVQEQPNCFNYFIKESCDKVLRKTNILEEKYSLKETSTFPFQNLDMISKEEKETSEKNTQGKELILESLVGQCGRNTFNFLLDLSVFDIKKLFYYQNSTSEPLILAAENIGLYNLEVIKYAIKLFDEQLIRQNEEEHPFEADLFHLNYDEKRAIVIEELSSYIDYLETNADRCVWGDNNKAKIRYMREALISKSVAAIRNKERMINTFTNYTTLTELEMGVIKNKTLDRFIRRRV